MNDISITMFLSVARTKSFTATANEMYTTKQFVSKSIQSLEEELGFTLFLRDSHSVVLTEAGEHLRECFLNGVTLLYNPAVNNLFAERRILTLGIDDWVGAPAQLAPILSRFEEEHNCGIRIIQLGEGKAMALLQSKEVDGVIASRYLTRRLTNLCETYPLSELELQLQIAVDHPNATNENWERLKSVPFLTTFAGEGSLTEVYDRTRGFCKKLGYVPNTINVLPNYASVVTELTLGNGVTVSPLRPPVMDAIQIPLRMYVTIVFARRRDSRDPLVDALLQMLVNNWGGDAL